MKKRHICLAILFAIVVSCAVKKQSEVTAELLYTYSPGEEQPAQKPSDSLLHYPGDPEKTLAQFKNRDQYHIFVEDHAAVNIISVNNHKYGVFTDSISTSIYEFRKDGLKSRFYFTETELGVNVQAEAIDMNNDGFQDIVIRYYSGGFYGEDDICLLFNPNGQRLENTGKLHNVEFDPIARKVYNNWKFTRDTYDIVNMDFSFIHREIQYDDDAGLSLIPPIKILDKYLAQAMKLERDSILHPINNDSLNNYSRTITMGKFIDGKKLYAIDVDSPDENAAIDFYEYNGSWQKIGEQQTAGSVMTTEFIDFDGDGRKEIVFIGNYNMNGNSMNEIYYVPQTGPVHYAGGFFGVVNEELINAKEKTFDTHLEGSWYAPREFTQYEWHNEKLIAMRQLVISLKIADMKHDAQWIEYYENPTTNRDSMVLKYRKTLSFNKEQKALMKTFNVDAGDF